MSEYNEIDKSLRKRADELQQFYRLEKICIICQAPFTAERAHKKCCSPKCRQRLHLQRKKAKQQEAEHAAQ